MGNRSNAVVFDEQIEGVCIAFYPGNPRALGTSAVLWWVLPPTLEAIFEVADLVEEQRLPVRAIVIGGLDAYPIRVSRWPKVLAKLSRIGGPERIMVDTDGLSERQRRKLISSTQRQYKMSRNQDPIQAVWTVVKNWAEGRV